MSSGLISLNPTQNFVTIIADGRKRNWTTVVQTRLRNCGMIDVMVDTFQGTLSVRLLLPHVVLMTFFVLHPVVSIVLLLNQTDEGCSVPGHV